MIPESRSKVICLLTRYDDSGPELFSLCQPFSKSKLICLLTRFDISRPDLTFRDQNCWFYSNPESTVWMVCVFFRMAIPILTTRINQVGSRINKVGPRINKGGPRINKGGPRINKVGKPESINRVARPIWGIQVKVIELSKLTSNTDHICLLNSQKRLFNFFSFSKSQNYCRLPMAVAVSSTHFDGLNHCVNQIPFAGTYLFTQLLIWYSSQPYSNTHAPKLS